MRLLYKLVSAITGRIAAKLGKTIFRGLWSRLEATDPPPASASDASLPKVVGAAALEAATMAGVAATVKRITAAAFHHLFGVWPEDKGSRQQGSDKGSRQQRSEKRSREQRPAKR